MGGKGLDRWSPAVVLQQSCSLPLPLEYNAHFGSA